jgi:hypothetical protein
VVTVLVSAEGWLEQPAISTPITRKALIKIPNLNLSFIIVSFGAEAYKIFYQLKSKMRLPGSGNDKKAKGDNHIAGPPAVFLIRITQTRVLMSCRS